MQLDEIPSSLSTMIETKHCDLCDADMNSAVVAEIHYNGKKHQKKLKMSGLPVGQYFTGIINATMIAPLSAVKKPPRDDAKPAEEGAAEPSTDQTPAAADADADAVNSSAKVEGSTDAMADADSTEKKSDSGKPDEIKYVTTVPAGFVGKASLRADEQLPDEANLNNCADCRAVFTSPMEACQHYMGRKHKLRQLEKKKQLLVGPGGEEVQLPHLPHLPQLPKEEDPAGAEPAAAAAAADASASVAEATTAAGQEPADADKPLESKSDAAAVVKEAKPRPMCELCNIFTTSQGQMDLHLQGKSHKHQLKLAETAAAAAAQPASTHPYAAPTGRGNFSQSRGRARGRGGPGGASGFARGGPRGGAGFARGGPRGGGGPNGAGFARGGRGFGRGRGQAYTENAFANDYNSFG